MPLTQHFIYLLRPARPGMLEEGPTPDEAAAGERHFDYLKRLHEQGVVLQAGRTTTEDDRVFGIVILHAADQDAAESIMLADPGVAEGIMIAELFPYRVALG